MTAVTIIIDLVLIIVSIILILTVLMQQGQRQGLGAIGGGAETFFGKNKAKSYEGKLAKLTKICAVIFIVLALVATIVIGNPVSKSTVSGDADEDGFVSIDTATVQPATDDAEPEATDAADMSEDDAAEANDGEADDADTDSDADATAEPESTDEAE